MKISKNHLSLIIEYIVLESRAARQWIDKNVDPEDLTEGADLLIAYNSGIVDISMLSWIKKIRKIVPENYRELGIPLSVGEVSREGIPLFEKSIEISFIVEVISQFRKPNYQAIFRSNGYPTNLSTKKFPNILALISANAQVESAIRSKEDAKRRKKTHDTSLNYDPTQVELVGNFGPWTVLMPNTTAGSISCDMGIVKTTTWCTTKASGQNLFTGYVGSIAKDNDTILFYVMDYNRVPDDPNIERELPGTHNNDSRMSIGFVNGKPSFTDENGPVSVDASNANLTEDVIKEKLGLFYLAIMKAATKKAKEVGSNHPAKEIMKNAAKNLLALKQIIKDYTPASKMSFYKDMTKHLELHPEAFSPEVINHLTFNVPYEQHEYMRHRFLETASIQEIAKYVDIIEKSDGSEQWLKYSNFDEGTELVDDDFNVIINSLDRRKWLCIYSVLGEAKRLISETGSANLLDRVYLLAREYGEGAGAHQSQKVSLPPGLATEEEQKAFSIDNTIYEMLKAAGLKLEEMPEELKLNLTKLKELLASDTFIESIEQEVQGLRNMKENSDLPEHLEGVIDDISAFGELETENSLKYAEKLKVKENIREFFMLHKKYDDAGVKAKKRKFPGAALFSSRAYKGITHERAGYLSRNIAFVDEQVMTSDPYISDYDALIDYLFELFPAIKKLTVHPVYAKSYDGNMYGAFKAADLIGSIIKTFPRTETVQKVFDMTPGFFYQYLPFTQENYAIPTSIYVDFFKNVKLDHLVQNDIDSLVDGIGYVLIKRIEKSYKEEHGQYHYQNPEFEATPEGKAVVNVKAMMANKKANPS